MNGFIVASLRTLAKRGTAGDVHRVLAELMDVLTDPRAADRVIDIRDANRFDSPLDAPLRGVQGRLQELADDLEDGRLEPTPIPRADHPATVNALVEEFTAAYREGEAARAGSWDEDVALRTQEVLNRVALSAGLVHAVDRALRAELGDMDEQVLHFED